MIKTNDSGLGLVGVLVVILVIGVVGFASFWAMNNLGENTDDDDTAQEDPTAPDHDDSEDLASYSSTQTGLAFSYPEEWGEVNEADNIAENCQDQIDQGLVVEGEEYQYGFTNNTQASLLIRSSDFNVTSGVAHCLESLHVVEGSVDYKNLNSERYFVNQDGTYVFAAADSCIGEVESKYLQAVRETGSTDYGLVSVILDSSTLSETEAEAFCSGDELSKSGLDYTHAHTHFVESINIQ